MYANRLRSPYGYSSRLGCWMGLYLFLLSLCQLTSVYNQGTIFLLFPLLLGLPFMLYALMRAVWVRAPHLQTFGGIWLTGIWIFIFGALICGLLTAGWILLINPDFVEQYMRLAVADAGTEYSSTAAQIESMIEAGAYPTPMQYVFAMIWSTAFFGSILALIAAGILRARASHHPYTPY